MINLLQIFGNADRDTLYEFMLKKLPRQGVSTERRGGSNGTADHVDMKAVRQLLHVPGSTPRQSRGMVPVLHDKTCYSYYVQPYQPAHKVVSYPYSIPVKAGQLEITRNKLKEAPVIVEYALRVCVETKVLAAAAIDALNKRITASSGGWSSLMSDQSAKARARMHRHKHRLIVTEAVRVQQETDRIAKEKHGSDILGAVLEEAGGSKLSLVSAALDLHVDRTRSHSSFPKLQSFFEPKFLMVVPSRSCSPRKHHNIPPLGRGGAGSGKFVSACK